MCSAKTWSLAWRAFIVSRVDSVTARDEVSNFAHYPNQAVAEGIFLEPGTVRWDGSMRIRGGGNGSVHDCRGDRWRQEMAVSGDVKAKVAPDDEVGEVEASLRFIDNCFHDKYPMKRRTQSKEV